MPEYRKLWGFPSHKLGPLSIPAEEVVTSEKPTYIKCFEALRGILRRAVGAVEGWVLLVEVGAVVLVALGVSLWSVPAAMILGGLVLIAAIEIRPPIKPRFPSIPLPVKALRLQAETAARVINNERFGVGDVDVEAMALLSPAECERLVITARNILGNKKNALCRSSCSQGV